MGIHQGGNVFRERRHHALLQPVLLHKLNGDLVVRVPVVHMYLVIVPANANVHLDRQNTVVNMLAYSPRSRGNGLADVLTQSGDRVVVQSVFGDKVPSQ